MQLTASTPVYLPTQRVALVTGANKGIGREVAYVLGKTGARVLLGARDRLRGEAAAAEMREEGIYANYIHLDLNRPDSLQAAAEEIEEDYGRLDILVNNAGIADRADGLPGSASMDAVRRIFDTNFFGALSVTQAMLPLLRESRGARIVNVSSGLGSLAYNSDPQAEFADIKMIGYCASKAALNMLTVQLAHELRDSGIKVNSADPGYTATDLNGQRGYQSVAQGAISSIKLALLEDDGPSGGFFSAAQEERW
ncbi:MAG: SDR family NAD(P)-dependent oxidoreductase [Burkholderiaceae bacterium]|nr:SDR family NAD(P)-dependent oxidoreductase [Burkholderiaceae bacterium]